MTKFFPKEKFYSTKNFYSYDFASNLVGDDFGTINIIAESDSNEESSELNNESRNENDGENTLAFASDIPVVVIDDQTSIKWIQKIKIIEKLLKDVTLK